MNYRKMIVSALGMAGTVALLAAADAPTTRRGDAEHYLANSVERSLVAVSASSCSLNCEFTCSGNNHQAWPRAGGNDGGEQHGCTMSPEGCGAHTCNPTLMSAIDKLEAMLPEMSGASLDALQRRHADLVVNLERGAVQVRGCGGDILLSINLGERQRAEFVVATE